MLLKTTVVTMTSLAALALSTGAMACGEGDTPDEGQKEPSVLCGDEGDDGDEKEPSVLCGDEGEDGDEKEPSVF